MTRLPQKLTTPGSTFGSVLVRAFGASSDGEKLNSLAILEKMLAAEGCDYHDLRSHVENVASMVEPARTRPRPKPPPEPETEPEERKPTRFPRRLSFIEVAVFTHCFREFLDEKHHYFLGQMKWRAEGGSHPKGRHGSYLLSLYDQLLRHQNFRRQYPNLKDAPQ